jgi:protein brassinosteroid insensitive 2
LPLFDVQLANAYPDLISRLMPEHIRRQNGHNFGHAGN